MPAVPDSPESGVIHDIGYRHYEGQRLGRRFIRRSLFVESARGAYGLGRSARSKVMPMLLLAVMCVPALVLVVVAMVTGELPGGYTSYVLNVQVVVAVFVAAQAPAIVSRDLRFRVMSLYFSRPMQRTDYIQAKYAAMTAAVFVLLAVPLTILFVGALLAELPVGEQVPDYLRALAAAVLLSVVLAGLALVVSAITPRRGLGVAAIVTVLLVLAGVQGATQVIAVEEGADGVAAYAGLLSPFTLVDGASSAVLGSESTFLPEPVSAVGGAVYVGVTALLVVGCYVALVLRYRRVSVS